MSGDTAFPGGVDTAYGTEADYFSGTFDDIDGSGTDFSAWMRRVESASIAMQGLFPQVLGVAGGVAISNSSSAATLLDSTITIPANLLRAKSCLKINAYGLLVINDTNTTTVTLLPKFGSTTIATGMVAPASGTWTLSASVHRWELDLTVIAKTVGATADFHTMGSWRISQTTANNMDGSPGAAFTFAGGGTGGGTHDTTANITFDLKGQMSVASASNVFTGGLCAVTHIPYVA